MSALSGWVFAAWPELYAAPLDLPSAAGGGVGAGWSALGLGTRMLVPQARQRTVFPRAVAGTASTFRHVRFGHMIRTDCGMEAIRPRVSGLIGVLRAQVESGLGGSSFQA